MRSKFALRLFELSALSYCCAAGSGNYSNFSECCDVIYKRRYNAQLSWAMIDSRVIINNILLIVWWSNLLHHNGISLNADSTDLAIATHSSNCSIVVALICWSRRLIHSLASGSCFWGHTKSSMNIFMCRSSQYLSFFSNASSHYGWFGNRPWLLL